MGVVLGGDGEDTLRGHHSDDNLDGGRDADTFVFNTTSDSTHDANRDTILDFDFERGVDVIDLSGFSGTLTFIGSATYSGAAGEVRFSAAAERLYINVDGAGGSGFSIDPVGMSSIGADDLIL